LRGVTLIVKLSPNVTSIAQMAKCAEHAGSGRLSLGKTTFLSLSIDVETRIVPGSPTQTPVALSGPAIKPIAVRMVYEAARRRSPFPSSVWAASLPPEDAVEFLPRRSNCRPDRDPPATPTPRAVQRIADSLGEMVAPRHHIAKVKDLIGAVQVNE